MTKFEQIGIEHQYATSSTEEANKAFARSCQCCCNKGLHIDCDKCHISATHQLIVAIFSDMNIAKEC